MAAYPLVAQTAEIQTGATIKTLVQILAAAQHPILVHEIGVSFQGIITTGEPGLVRLLRQTTAGTMAALTVVTEDPGRDETIQTSAQHTATAEPTAGNVLRSWMVHPQSGLAYIPKRPILVQGGGRLGIDVTFAATIGAFAYIIFEE